MKCNIFLKYLLRILFHSHIICQVSGVLEWIVVGKVTNYGENVTLFCNVSNCCPKHAGWDMWTPVQRTLFIDLKTARATKKYDGKVLKDGYTLVIQNLTKQDLNVSYACLYDIILGERKFLLEKDVFKNITTEKLIAHSKFSNIEIFSIILGIIVLVVAVAVIVRYFWKPWEKKHRYTRRSIELQGLPRKISLEETNTFMEAIKSGKEFRKFVRIQVIGKDGAGKTSLVRRLHGEGIQDVISTDGIDIVKRCKINTSNQEWIIGKVETERNNMKRRIHQMVNINEKRNSTSKGKMVKAEGDQIGQESVTSTRHRIEITNGNSTSSINHSDSSNNSIEQLITPADSDSSSEDTPNIERFEMKNMTNHEQMPANQDPVKSEKSDHITEIVVAKMNEILLDAKNEKDKMTSEGLVECGIWDFAGQKDYYATHQTFFTPHAIYLLVADIEELIEDSRHDNHFDSIGNSTSKINVLTLYELTTT